MYMKSLLWTLLFISVQEVSLQDYDYLYEDDAYEDPQPLNCSTTEGIRGGHVTYSQGGLEGSLLTYHCGLGQYPFPVSYRICKDGQWSPMRLSSGRPVTQATCKDVMCPAQLQLDHGDFWPRDQWMPVGATQTFSCQDGFTLSGSAQRNCTLYGSWTGSTPVCDNHDEDCNDPSIPPGAQRTAGHFHIGDKVTYRCHAGLDLLGSAERVCLENREWSGTTPRCHAQNTFDSPSEVAAAIGGSLAGLMDVLTPDSKKKGESTSYGRSFRVAEFSRMNVYILLDTSGSIRKEDFDKSRDATIALIKKLDSYEVQMKFHVLSFASEVKDIVDITETEISSSIEDVIWRLTEFDYKSHGRKTGTNLYAALSRVNDLMSFFRQIGSKSHFNETQNIIIIETDGHSNIGPRPIIALRQIRNLLDYDSHLQDHTDETRLDVYVFGVGTDVKKDQLNALASKKRGENHVFVLKDYKSLGEVFNSIISDKGVTMCGIAQEDVANGPEAYTKPWHVTLTVTKKPSCFGSIVSQNWVLTSAHCFAKASTDDVTQQVDIKYGQGKDASMVLSKRVILHPKYNTRALEHRNVSEFYDYDVALVQMNRSIPLSWKARPICLPCTVPASRAMKKVNSTCQQHRDELIPHEQTAAFFIHSHKSSCRQKTHIHTKGQRSSCAEKAMQTLKEPTDVTLDEYVTDRFLCSGGAYQDAISCKGDSGGSLFLQKRQRYFQVGVLSWGTMNVCDSHLSGRGRCINSDNQPTTARDFHIDLFKIMPWLKQHLGEEIQFLPEFD